MAEFKPMVKMKTTEPSAVLKLKTGGSASHGRLMAEGEKMGHRPVKKMDGGVMGALAGSPPPVTPMGNPTAARAMAAKRMARRPTPPAANIPAPARPAAPPMAGRPAMKKGGEVETPAMHKAEMKAIKGVSKDLKKHEDMPASKAHKGLKTGGVAHGQGGFKTGGVAHGQGGFKKGGSTKKAFATGGAVDTGRPVAMPKKAPSKPVAISQLSGTFKDGGKVKC